MSDSKPGVSFSFSSRKTERNLKPADSKNFDSHKESQNEKDFVKNFEDNRIQGTKKKEEKKELVIPLISKNRWRVPIAVNEKQTSDQQTELSELDKQAAEEILAEVQRAADKENGESNGVDSNVEIPLLMQNKVPSGYETDDKVDTALRAEESTLDDYESIPVEAYGMAMLRGMGWKPTEGIGLTNKANVSTYEIKQRPKGLGLGANPAILKKATSTKPNHGEEELKLIVNAHVQVLDGKHQGMYGQVISLDANTGRVLVRMAVGGIEVEINELLLKPVSAKEYKDSARVLNKDKYDRYKTKQEKERQEEEERRHREGMEKKSKRRSRSPSKDLRGRSRSRDRTRERSRSRSKERKHKSEKSKKQSKDRDEKRESWLHPNLRVRCVDEHFKKGQFYKEKMIVIDVVSKKYCTCRTETGKLLENVSISKLETVIPRGERACVMVVSGKKRGQICEVIEKDKERYLAVVQTLPDRDDVFQISYDDICEYVGEILDF